MWVFHFIVFSSKMVTFPLKRLQNAILFYFCQRKAPDPCCVLPQGRAQGTNFFLSIVQQFSFCFFIQVDSLVRLAQFDLKVTDRLPWFPPTPPSILNRDQISVGFVFFFFWLFSTFPGVKAKNELDFFFQSSASWKSFLICMEPIPDPVGPPEGFLKLPGSGNRVNSLCCALVSTAQRFAPLRMRP